MSSEISASSATPSLAQTESSQLQKSLNEVQPNAPAQRAEADRAERTVEPPSRQQLEKLTEAINDFVSQMQRNLSFSVDDTSGHTVVKVLEKDSGELIRQIPSEEFLQLSRSLEEQMNSLLFDQKA